jgi:hypothetical protein
MRVKMMPPTFPAPPTMPDITPCKKNNELALLRYIWMSADASNDDIHHPKVVLT